MRRTHSKDNAARLFTPVVVLALTFLTSPVRAEYFVTPDTPSLLGGTIWESHEIVRNDAGTFSLERALPAGTPLDATHQMDSGDWLLSVLEPTELDGLYYDPRDVVQYDGSTFSLFFNGVAAGVPAVANVDAVFLLGGDAGDLVLSFDIPVSIAGVIYEPADLVRYNGVTFSTYFDASLANPPIPLSTNVIEADERAGKLYLSLDVPTTLGGTTYLPGQVVTWNGSNFAVRFNGNGWPAGSAMTGLALGDCLDGDGDDFGDPGEPACSGGGATDCDDTASVVNPGASELCDGLDNDCDTKVDEGGLPDDDGDGYAAGCGDCDDTLASVFSAAPQICDGFNNNCLHPSWPALAGTNEVDDDGDTFAECLGDCNDMRASVYPGAAQLCGDGLNNNCSLPSWPTLVATNEGDDDGDSFTECGGDCDDTSGIVWAAPGEARSLLLSIDQRTLNWSAPTNPGGVSLLYDTIRSSSTIDFVGPASCVEADDGVDRIADDPDVPAPATVFYYLVRVENSCPNGLGPLGFSSSGMAKAGRSCP